MPQEMIPNYFCNFPLHHVSRSVSAKECVVECMETTGCLSFNHHKNTDTCVIVAPSDADVQVDDKHDPGWSYYGI